MKSYMTLFVAELAQDSGLLIGGTDDLESQIDDIFCRDGAGRLTMRGRGTKGALVATARKIDGTVPDFISGIEAQHARSRAKAGGPPVPTSDQTKLKSSLWTVYTSHPKGTVRLEYRESVGLRQATKARADGVLRDFEATSRGTVWPFLLEVQTHSENGEEAERLAAATLLEWSRERLWLGKDVARGLGWLSVRNLRALRLPVESALDWPNSQVADPIDAATKLAPDAKWIKVGDFERTFGTLKYESPWRYVEIRARLRTGPREDGYGLEALSVGGVSPTGPTDGRSGTWLAPRSARAGAEIAGRSSSAMFSETVPASGKAISQPVIGGGSIRGPARHALSRTARLANKEIRDPNVGLRDPKHPFDSVEASFGTLDKSAALLVRDAPVLAPDEISWAVVQHHAEDQFSAGVFSDAKFDRAAVFKGDFDLRIVLETRDGLCCTNRLMTEVTLSPDGLIPRLQ